MNPTSTLYNTLAYRYGLSVGNSYYAEIFAIVVWSRCMSARVSAVAPIRASPTAHSSNGFMRVFVPTA
jgi:hypothetical protein